jgi:hypothetical protein
MNDLKDGLERLAATPGPAPAVDVAAAVAKGRRVRRGRRAAVALLAAGAVAVAAGVVVLQPSQDERPDKVVEPSKYPSLLTEKAVFGWLPAGFVRTRVTQDGGRRPAYTVNAGRGPGNLAIELTLLAPGVKPGIPALPGGRKGRLTKAAPVNGRPAYWWVKPGGPGSGQVGAEFGWEYRPRTWALLAVRDRGIADAATVQRIAAGVRFGGGPVPFPMRITGVPGGLEIARAEVGTGPDVVLDLRVPGEGGELGISLSPAGARTALRFEPNTAIDGYPAFDSRLPHAVDLIDWKWPNSRLLQIYGVRGFDIRVSAGGEPVRRLQASGGLTGLFRRVTLLGPDPAHWTATPLR